MAENDDPVGAMLQRLGWRPPETSIDCWRPPEGSRLARTWEVPVEEIGKARARDDQDTTGREKTKNK